MKGNDKRKTEEEEEKMLMKLLMNMKMVRMKGKKQLKTGYLGQGRS
jgi:hypothetical protein